MLVRYIGLIACCLVSVAFLVLALTNQQQAALCVLSHEFQVSLGLLLAGVLVSGFLTGTLTGQIFSHQAPTNKRQLEWEVQDAKLIAQVKSDREKLLEAK
ncbi:MAG: hypothetical protein HY711_11640, partial [Candidatus Melainabacteria bacterium]|nr:hypothetical protein [Candidatus Melainabacteria bacterium]